MLLRQCHLQRRCSDSCNRLYLKMCREQRGDLRWPKFSKSLHPCSCHLAGNGMLHRHPEPKDPQQRLQHRRSHSGKMSGYLPGWRLQVRGSGEVSYILILCHITRETTDLLIFSGNGCFCGNAIAATGTVAGDCAIPCAGNTAEICGGVNRLTMFIFE
jgi:hypothetical protein